MGNFTKSILYSTTVLAVGLVAIFAIYSGVTEQSSSQLVAGVEPAAGESDFGIKYDSQANTITPSSGGEATPVSATPTDGKAPETASAEGAAKTDEAASSEPVTTEAPTDASSSSASAEPAAAPAAESSSEPEQAATTPEGTAAEVSAPVDAAKAEEELKAKEKKLEGDNPAAKIEPAASSEAAPAEEKTQ